MSAPEQDRVDLRTQAPEGWTLHGLTAPRWDGVNFFREAQPVSEIRFSTPEPRYVRFQYRLEPRSPVDSLNAEVSLDGNVLGRYVFSKKNFEIFYPAGFVGAGQHSLRLSYTCADSPCQPPASQYYAEMVLVFLESAKQSSGLHAEQINLNVPQVTPQVNGSSQLLFDGVNFFRTLDGALPVTLTFPTPLPLTDLRYQSLSLRGDYRLTWQVNGGATRQAAVEQPGLGQTLPAKRIVDQYLSLVQPLEIKTLRVTARCATGDDACFPIRLYFPRVTVLREVGGYSSLSSPQQLSVAVGLTLLLVLLVWLLFGPWRGSRELG